MIKTKLCVRPFHDMYAVNMELYVSIFKELIFVICEKFLRNCDFFNDYIFLQRMFFKNVF